jgi:hypothetical protein
MWTHVRVGLGFALLHFRYLLYRTYSLTEVFRNGFQILSIADHLASKKAGTVLTLLFGVRRLISFLNEKEGGLDSV